jgi:YgiT-type zinc finger domain-containing protein
MCLEQRDDVVTYKGREKHLKARGWWCSQCGEAILDGEALAARERAFLDLKAEVDGAPGPDEVAAVAEARSRGVNPAAGCDAVLDELAAEAQKLGLGY